MKSLRPAALFVQGLLSVFVLWLYPGDLVRYLRAQGAPVAMMAEMPSLTLSLLGTLVALGFTAALILVALKKQSASWRPRVMLLAASMFLLFIDFTVLASRRSAITAESRMLLTITTLCDEAERNAAVESVVRDPQLLQSFVANLGAVPLFVEGQRVAGWKVEVRERCAGPALEPGSSSPGTLIYCVSSDRHHAWVTLVGTSLGQTFGAPAVVSTEGDWLGEVSALEPPAEEPGPPVWGEPTPGDEP